MPSRYDPVRKTFHCRNDGEKVPPLDRPQWVWKTSASRRPRGEGGEGEKIFAEIRSRWGFYEAKRPDFQSIAGAKNSLKPTSRRRKKRRKGVTFGLKKLKAKKASSAGRSLAGMMGGGWRAHARGRHPSTKERKKKEKETWPE